MLVETGAIPLSPVPFFFPSQNPAPSAILRAMVGQAKPTPNPNAMKFTLPARLFARPLSFASREAAAAHPLAAAIFALGRVYNVFMVQDFITVNKLPEVAWESLVEPIQECIENYLTFYGDAASEV